MDGSNFGWWVPLLVCAVPLLLLLSLYLLARLESWMFESDERAIRVAKLLEEMDGPDEIEQEVARMLAGVAGAPAPTPPPAHTRLARSGPSPGPGRAAGDRSHRSRLRRVIAGPDRPDPQSH